MTVDAEELAVTNHAHPRLGCGLLVVDREEIRAVHRLPHRGVEREPRRDRRDRHAMTGRTLALRVTGRAEVALCVGLNSVLAKKVAVVDHMALWRDTLRLKLHVTAITVAHVPLSGVLVAAKARGHIGSKGGVFVADVHVAAHAISGAFLGMACVGKTQMLTRHLGSMACPSPAMAVLAGVRVVRIFVTLDATGRRRKVQRAGLTRFLDAPVTLEAVDAFQHVSSMFERTLRRVVLALQAEDLGAGAR